MAEVILTTDSFDEEVLKSEVPVLVDFWATWCGPCKMMGPVVAQLAEECGAAAKICKLNVDDHMAIAQRYGIMSIPTFLVFKNGELSATQIGTTSKDALKDMLGL